MTVPPSGTGCVECNATDSWWFTCAGALHAGERLPADWMDILGGGRG
ncbi:hypothetical protein HCX50_03995 [Microbacterium oxydans]|nr:hypothetical protein [Microbacterium sp. B19(2022)]NJI58588.1 hypothetical protein [Microbacterium sp. B19(2022)]